MESVVKKIKIIQCQSCVNQCPKILSAVYKSAIIPPTSFHPPTTSHEPQATSPYPLSPPRPVFTSLFDIHYSIFMCRRHHSIPLQRTTIIYFRPKPRRGKPTKPAVDAGRAFADVYIEKRPAEVHPWPKQNRVNPVLIRV